LIAALLLAWLAGCAVGPPLPPVNLSAGWSVQEGQAVWRRYRQAPELAGELLLATHPEGSTLVQFTKTPLPFINAQTNPDRWQLEFIPQKRTVRGLGVPPARFIWLHVARSLMGVTPPKPLRFEPDSDHAWRLENERTGEFIAGYLRP